MKRWIGILLFCGLVPATAAAQSVTVRFGPPEVRWEVRPPLVVIAPGYWVVEDSPHEVFYARGWFWTEHNGLWYRARDHRGRWKVVKPVRVPPPFVAREPGYYRHFRGEVAPPPPAVRPPDRRAGPPRKGPGKHGGKPGKAGKHR